MRHWRWVMPTIYSEGPRVIADYGDGSGVPALALRCDEGSGRNFDDCECGIEANGAGDGYGITREAYAEGELEYPNGDGEGVGHYETATMEIRQ